MDLSPPPDNRITYNNNILSTIIIAQSREYDTKYGPRYMSLARNVLNSKMGAIWLRSYSDIKVWGLRYFIV